MCCATVVKYNSARVQYGTPSFGAFHHRNSQNATTFDAAIGRSFTSAKIATLLQNDFTAIGLRTKTELLSVCTKTVLVSSTPYKLFRVLGR